jgi:uncharacterized membrane protein YfcA
VTLLKNKTLLGLPLLLAGCAPAAAWAADGALAAMPWWGWPILLFAVCFAIGVVAVLAGVGGGVLFVPIVGGFLPFHLDFVRGAGIMLALCSSLAAAPSLLKSGLASLRLSLPLAITGSVASVGGAMLGLALPTSVVQVSLGLTILAIVALMLVAGRAERPSGVVADQLARALGLRGTYEDVARASEVAWTVRRTPMGLALSAVIGLMGGMFGIGAGWANVPLLNLVMGAPLKVAVASGGFLISMVNSSAAWIYINRGAVLPILVAPSVLGVVLGARIGARLLTRVHSSVVRRVVVVLLLVAGLRALLKGLGIWT